MELPFYISREVNIFSDLDAQELIQELTPIITFIGVRNVRNERPPLRIKDLCRLNLKMVNLWNCQESVDYITGMSGRKLLRAFSKT